jgi:uncharacterized protein YjiK
MKSVFLAVLVMTGIFVFLCFSNVNKLGASPRKNQKEKLPSRKKINEGDPGTITVTRKWELPATLTEISGLAYINAERFACIQDEIGTIFIYNIATSSVEKQIPFAGIGDYEGITLVNDTAWVVRSDGHLFEIKGISSEKPGVNEYSTNLAARPNFESLCYDPLHNRLLMASKNGEPDNRGYKGIYAFDLTSKSIMTEPVFLIDLSDKILAGTHPKKNSGRGLMPSEFAIHPVTHELYITDGPAAKLLVLDSSGIIRKLYTMNPREFPQAEGITFTPRGELFISNEGLKEPGNILKVEY